jgi:hypothetical protein
LQVGRGKSKKQKKRQKPYWKKKQIGGKGGGNSRRMKRESATPSYIDAMAGTSIGENVFDQGYGQANLVSIPAVVAKRSRNNQNKSKGLTNLTGDVSRRMMVSAYT